MIIWILLFKVIQVFREEKSVSVLSLMERWSCLHVLPGIAPMFAKEFPNEDRVCGVPSPRVLGPGIFAWALEARPRRKGLSLFDSSAPQATGRLHGLCRVKWHYTRIHRIYKYFDYNQCRANTLSFYFCLFLRFFVCVSAGVCPVFDLSN